MHIATQGGRGTTTGILRLLRRSLIAKQRQRHEIRQEQDQRNLPPLARYASPGARRVVGDHETFCCSQPKVRIYYVIPNSPEK